MYKLNILLSASLLFVFTASAQISDLAAELSKDFDKPIKVNSENQFIDAKKKIAIYENKVLIQQGSLVIQADYLEVDGQRGKGSEKFTAKGTPASYTQTLEDGSQLVAKAQSIEYDLPTRTIALAGEAELIQNASTVKANSITFDMLKEQIIASGNAQGDQQVETIFSPNAIDTKSALEKVKQEREKP